MRDAMIAGTTLNIFNNHSDRVRMANLAQCINVLQAVILTDGAKLILTPTYHVMEMYNVHEDATLLPVSVNSEWYEHKGEKLPAISASASKAKDGVVHVSLVNIDPDRPHKVSVTMHGAKFKDISGRILSSAKVNDYNSASNPDKIQPKTFKGATMKGESLNVVMPPASVVVLSLN
jgi:alpha-N-arabinofuranosidase